MFCLFVCSSLEILFEPETKFRIESTFRDPKVRDATRIIVSVLDTPPVLEEVVSRFQKTCEVNRDKENTSHGKREVAPRLACSCPVLPLER